jgi:oxygen-independent coproporphyrinogen-3 oxidase
LPSSRPISAADPTALAVYVHWPFCLSKCPYCDFNSHVRAAIDEAAWAAALLAALDRQAPPLTDRTVTSIFFGGGTPSLMAPATVGAVIDRVARLWRLADDIEITLEANPTSVEAGRFRGYRAAGVDRVSIGVQSLDAAALAFLGRTHDPAEAVAAIKVAASVFPRHSFDLIYARPGQTERAWLAELERALDLAGDHLSVYQLTIEAGTRFETLHARGDFALPDDDLAGALHEATAARLAAAGYAAYEVSNHARPGGESRHNLAYWRYGDHLGVGPGAHGRTTRDGVKRATRQAKAPETWLAAIADGGDGMAEVVTVAPDDRHLECLMMGLRLAEGVPFERLAREAPDRPDIRRHPALPDLVAGGFVTVDARSIAATAAGRQRLNAVLERLLF